MPSNRGDHDTITIGIGALEIYQANYGRIFKVQADSVDRLESSHLSTTYIVRKGRCTNIFVGKPKPVVARALAEARRRLEAVSDRQLSLPGSQGPDEL